MSRIEQSGRMLLRRPKPPINGGSAPEEEEEEEEVCFILYFLLPGILCKMYVHVTVWKQKRQV